MKKLNVSRLHPKFEKLVRGYLEEHSLTQADLAVRLDIKRTHFNQLLNNHSTRPLTIYYLAKFLEKGVFTVKQIYDGNPESEREERFWKKVTNEKNWELLEVAEKIRAKGGQPLTILKAFLDAGPKE